MKASEADDLIKCALMNTRGIDSIGSRVCKSMTMAQALFSVGKWIAEYPADYELSPLMEKRVKQACQNKMRPL
jgi:hypothetical protein